MKKNLVVGAGFSGATIARKIAEELNEKVIIIDSKNHIAGNAYDYRDKNNIMIHKYGSHIFHTNNEEVWNFISRFSSFNTYMHKVYAIIDGIETRIPFNFNTLYDVFPQTLAKRLEEKLLEKFEFNTKVPILEFQKENDEDLKFISNYIYEKVFLHYTTKQWGLSPKEVDGAVTARVPIYLSKDNRYFQDKYQGIPLKGYTKTVEEMLNHPNIEIRLETKYSDYKSNYDRMFYTGSIDELLDFKYGQLPYRSVNFKFEEYDFPYYQNNSVVNYPCNYDFTRIHEYKYYLNNISPKTVIAKEYSQAYQKGENEPYYPIANEDNISLYNKYKKDLNEYENIYVFGRLGDYKYYNMDKAIERALNIFKELKCKL